MKDNCTESLVKPQGQVVMITKASRSALGRSNGHTSHLRSHEKVHQPSDRFSFSARSGDAKEKTS
jgi:hypothetical protein